MSKSGKATSGGFLEESLDQSEKAEDKSFTSRNIFPVIGEVNRSVTAPPILLIFQYFILFVQIFLGSYNSINPNDDLPNWFHIIVKVFFFGLEGDTENMMPFFLILASIDIITAIILILIFADYHNNHDFKIWQLRFMRIWDGLLFSYFIIPNIFFSALALGNLGISFTPTSIVIFVLSVVTLILTFIHVYLITILLNTSPFLFHGSPFHWRPLELFEIVIVFGIIYSLNRFFQQLDPWIFFIPPILEIIASPYIFYKMWYLPFTNVISNVLWASLTFGILTASIFSIIRELDFPQINSSILIFVPIGVWILSCCIIFPIFYMRRKKIKFQLSYDSLEDMSPINEEMKQIYLRSLKIHQKSQVYMYLQVGIEEGSDMFLDWSLPHYILENFLNDTDLLIFVMLVVSFFPSEIFSMHNYILAISKKKKLSLINRAMFFQLHRIHMFRQSSSSKEANSDLNKIKKMSEQCINAFCSVWKNLIDKNFQLSLNAYNVLTTIRHNTEASWSEMLDKYPNNSRFLHEYANFLLDGKCQFKDAIKYHQKAISLEQGNKVQNDRMFHRFIQKFPFYLKKGIVDPRGKIKRKAGHEGGTTFVDQLQSENSSADSSDDIDLMESENFVPQAQLRLAFGRCVSDLHSKVSHNVILSAIFALLITVIYAIIISIMLHDKFNESVNIFSYLTSMNKIMQTYEMISKLFPWMWSENILNEDMDDFFVYGSIYEMPNYLNTETTNEQQVYNLSLLGLTYIDELFSDLYETGNYKNDKMLNLTKLLSNTYLNNIICDPIYKEGIVGQQTTLDYLWRSFFFYSAKLTMGSNSDTADWNNNVDFCNAMMKSTLLSKYSKLIGMNISKQFYIEYTLYENCGQSHYLFNENSVLNEDGQVVISSDECPIIITLESQIEELNQRFEDINEEETYNVLIAFSPFLIFALSLPTTIFVSSGLINEKKGFTQHLNSFSKQDCQTASERIDQKSQKNEDKGKIDSQELKNFGAPSYLLNVICAAFIIALLLVQLISSNSYNKKLNSIIEHYIMFGMLRNEIFDSVTSTMMMSFLYQAKTENLFTPNFLDDTFFRERIREKLNIISLIDSMLSLGYNDVSSAYGFEKSIDNVMFQELCTVPFDISYTLEYYQCISFKRIITFFTDSIKSFLDTISIHPLISEEMIIFNALSNTRLALGFLELTTTYENIFHNTLYDFKLIVWICFGFTVLIAFLMFASELMIVVNIERELDTFKCILLRINPVSFSANSQTLSLIYGKKSFTDAHIISASHSVYNSSQEAMISLNQDGVIELLNPAASEIFGYTPEQMLGQNLKILFNPELKNNSQLFYTMQLMKSGQCGLISEADYAGTKDDETIMPIRVTLLGFSSNERVAESFAIVCRDKTEEERQKEKVEIAQRESESLLMQFVPKDMLAKLSKDEPELAFSVPSATIVFIGIVDFPIFMDTQKPSDLLSSLSKIYASFDKVSSTIPSMTRIKIMGELYFAAGGLFSTPDIAPSAHANDVVNFSLSCLDSIEEINIQMNSNIQIQIGVHTGGPITAGVLSIDKQIFDIVGTSVTVCQQIKEKSLPGSITISNDTYELVNNGPYQIKPFQEIELKGIGTQMTYSIQPGHITSSPSTNGAYTPSLDALLSGCNSAYSLNAYDLLAPNTSEYMLLDPSQSFQDDPSSVNTDISFQPSLSALIHPSPI